MINGMDVEYASVCVNYIKEWIAECDAENWEITQDNMEYIVVKGGHGIRDLEESFHKLVEAAREQNVSKIDADFIDKVLS